MIFNVETDRKIKHVTSKLGVVGGKSQTLSIQPDVKQVSSLDHQ